MIILEQIAQIKKKIYEKEHGAEKNSKNVPGSRKKSRSKKENEKGTRGGKSEGVGSKEETWYFEGPVIGILVRRHLTLGILLYWLTKYML